jgi:two-component system, response regulator, stage 0 sporulation protein F
MTMTTLLVVDEEVNTRLLYKDEFRDEGYEVTVAETTEEAMEIIHQSKPDIITLDLKMPGTKGIDFLRKIKEEESGIPVVLCSAYARYKKDLRVAVCDAFVVQSADLTELKTVVKRILSHKQSDLVLRAFKNGETLPTFSTMTNNSSMSVSPMARHPMDAVLPWSKYLH